MLVKVREENDTYRTSNWYGSFAAVHKSSFCAQIVTLFSTVVRGSLLARKGSTPFRIAEVVPFPCILIKISLIFVHVAVQQVAEGGTRHRLSVAVRGRPPSGSWSWVVFTGVRDCPLKFFGVPVNFPVKSS